MHNQKIIKRGRYPLYAVQSLCMPRLARTVFANVPHHITQRGNRREDIFLTNDDRAHYLTWLTRYCQQHTVETLAYCLMSNYLHQVAVPATESALERVCPYTCVMRNALIDNGGLRGTSGKDDTFRHR